MLKSAATIVVILAIFVPQPAKGSLQTTTMEPIDGMDCINSSQPRSASPEFSHLRRMLLRGRRDEDMPERSVRRHMTFEGPVVLMRLIAAYERMNSFHAIDSRPVDHFLDAIDSTETPDDAKYSSLMRSIESAVAAEAYKTNPRDIWNRANGSRLLSMAVADKSKRKSLVIPLIMLVTGIGIPPSERLEFARETGLTLFCESHADDIMNALVNDHRMYYNLRKNTAVFAFTSSVQRFITISTFAADFPHFCPSVFTSTEVRLVVLIQEHLRARLIAEMAFRKQISLKEVRRKTAFSSAISRLNSDRVSLGIAQVDMESEIGQGVGVLRDWFTAATIELFNDEYGIFQFDTAGKYYKLHPLYADIMPKTAVRAAGAFLALSIIEGVPIGVNLPMYLFNFFADNPIDLETVEVDDPIAAKSIREIMNMDETQLNSADFFLESGETVTMENRDIFVHEFLASIIPRKGLLGEAFNAMKEGFRVVIPQKFVPMDMKKAILGTPIIDAEALIPHIQFEKYTASSDQIQWLFELLRSWDQITLGKWLSFVTGTMVLPIGGVEAYSPAITIVKTMETTKNLPRSRTCFNLLQLPVYESKKVLEERLLLALYSDAGMGLV